MILIKNGTVYTVEDGVLEQTDVLIENKTIKAIGKNLSEKDATIIDATGLNVFPGFIDGHSHLGIHEEAIGFEGNDTNEMTEPITPQVRAIDGINPMDMGFRDAYAGGVTTVATGPGSANVIGGQYTSIKTYGKCIDDMIVKEVIGMKIAFGENPKRVYNAKAKMPMTRMGTAALLRETILRAKDYMTKKENAKDGNTPAYDFRLEAMIPVLKKEIPLKAHAHRADDIFTAIRIAKEFDLDMTLDHCTEGHLIADEIKKSGFSAFVGPSMTSRSKFELVNKTFKTPAALVQAGVEIAIVTDAPVIPQEYLKLAVGLAMNEGLSFEDGLKAITINPARMLGIDHRIGSLKVGKDADIVIVNGCPFTQEKNIVKTIIDGKVVFEA